MESRANLQSAEHLLAPDVSATVEALELSPKDKAAARLAVKYAKAIDAAYQSAAWADRVLKDLDKFECDDQADWDTWEKMVDALRARLSVQNTLKDLGPKLAALLADLGATPMARAVMVKRGQGGAAAPHPANPLAALQADVAGRHVS